MRIDSRFAGVRLVMTRSRADSTTHEREGGRDLRVPQKPMAVRWATPLTTQRFQIWRRTGGEMLREDRVDPSSIAWAWSAFMVVEVFA